MSLFGSSDKSDRFGVIIDIGSGSVLIAIVHSDTTKNHPQIIWSHREYVTLRNTKSLEQSAKAIVGALVNSAMKLDTEGRQVLQHHRPAAKITQLQYGISAPWSYTVTKTINYNQETNFIVTEELIQELTETVQTDIENNIKEDESLLDLGLEVVARVTMNITSNGYHITNPTGNKAKQLSISRASVITQEYLVRGINEISDKIFSELKGSKLSFILILHEVTKKLFAKDYDLSLVDITDEATEIGIVRDGTLSYCTHVPVGTFSLARDISDITKVPLSEAFGYLQQKNFDNFIKTLTPKQQAGIETIFDSYIESIAALFHETGDPLSIPKKILLHSDLRSEPLFLNLIKKAAKRALKTEPYVFSVSKEIIKQTYTLSTDGTNNTMPTDTALLLSAWFFHTHDNQKLFEYL